MRVAIVGAGLIGSHAARQLVEEGHEVVLVDALASRDYVEDVVGIPVDLEGGDAGDVAALVDFLLRHRPDAVVHTVGLIGGLAQRAPWKAMQANVFATANIAEAARIAHVRRLVYISTTGVYDIDQCRTEPMTEESPTSSATVYPAGKLAAEHVLEAYGRATDLEVVALRVANVYGRGRYVTGSIGGQSFNALIEPVVTGQPGVVMAGAKGRGEWVYVKDVARAVCLSLLREVSQDFLVVNIGTGTLTTHEDIIAAMVEVYPQATFTELEVASMPALRERHQPYDLRLAEASIGYTPRWDLANGVTDYAAEVRAFLDRRHTATGELA